MSSSILEEDLIELTDNPKTKKIKSSLFGPEKPHYTGHRRRLKKRLIESKIGTTPDYEILEILLFSSQARSDVKPLAKRLIYNFGSFAKIFSATVDELREVPGINETAVAIIKCVREAVEYILKEDVKTTEILNNWKKLLSYLKGSMGNEKTEKFRILYLNTKHILLLDELQETGTIDQTPLYVREVIKRALSIGAASLIIAHNHPSGDCNPSKADIALTSTLQKACEHIGIRLVDHLIITNKNHFSFASQGLL